MPLTIPIGEVMDESGSFAFVPEVKQKGYFDIDYKQNELVLVAGKFIGQIPLTPDISIHVKPKVPLGNLARVIGVANQPVRCLDYFRRKYEVTADTSSSLLEAMARSLVLSLREVDAEGVFREYIPRSETLAGPRGRIAIGAYMRESLSRSRPTAVPCTYHLLSPDTIFNRVIKKALWIVGNALSEVSGVDRKLILDIEYFFDKFGAVQLDEDPKLSMYAGMELSRKHVPDLRAYYVDILDISFMILGGSGVEVLSAGDSVNLHSFVINLEDVFETYLREVLRNSDLLRDNAVSTLDGNKEGKAPLFLDNSLYEAKPDFVVLKSGVTSLIGDAKYKTKLAEADRYQLIAHSLSYQVKSAFFVTPALSADKAGAVKIGAIGGPIAISLSHYRFDLNADSLQAEEQRFVEWVAGSV